MIIITELQIKELAYKIWEEEGCPEGKDAEHYFCARQILEERKASSVPESKLFTEIKLHRQTPASQAPPPVIDMAPAQSKFRRHTDS